MSADNGIYIAKFPVDDSYFEYRVVEAQNIEDCFPNEATPENVTDATVVKVFGNCKVFMSENKAHAHAQKLYDKVMASECPIVEYGVCGIEFKKPIADMSICRAEAILNNFYVRDGSFADKFLVNRDVLRKLIEGYPTTQKETVYEQAVRYAKIAYEAYVIKLQNDRAVGFDYLPENIKQAWIEVAIQIEKATLKDNP